MARLTHASTARAMVLMLVLLGTIAGCRNAAPAPPASPSPAPSASPVGLPFPAYPAVQAVVAYLDRPTPERAQEAQAACETARRANPRDVFSSILLAFCCAERGDVAQAKAVTEADFPSFAYLYDYLFRVKRQEIGQALRLLAPYKCLCRRQEIGLLAHRDTRCPVTLESYATSVRKQDHREVTVYQCPRCDQLLQAGGTPPLVPLLEQVATSDELVRDRLTAWQDNPSRLVTPTDLYHALGLKPNLVLADIGCGLGSFSLPFAQATGAGGRLYAQDIEQCYLDLVSHGARANGLNNVVPVLGRIDDVGLPEHSLDYAFMCEVYKSVTLNRGGAPPEAFERGVASFFRSLHRSLKRQGQLIIVNKHDEKNGMSAGPIRARLQPYGFRLVRSVTDFPREDILFFAKMEETP